MCYWLAASTVAWALLSIAGLHWRALGPVSASTILIAMGIGCVADWKRNRTVHCGITAPVFLSAGLVFLLSDTRVVHVQPRFVWPFVLVGTGIAFLLEWKCARRSRVGKTL
jgi:hypothetical protein